MGTVPIPANATLGDPVQPQQSVAIPQGATIGNPVTQPDQPAWKQGASEATGLSAGPGLLERTWNDIKGGLTAAQPGGGLTPQPTALGNAAEFAGMIGTTASGLLPASEGAEAAGATEGAVRKAIPSAERAGATMNKLKEAIGTHPVEMTNELSKATSRAQELADNGNTMPVAVRKFINRVTDPEKGHLTYSEARDFMTKFGNMTSEEASRMAPSMKRQIQVIREALRDSVEETATRAGKLEQFQQSMREYQNSQRLQAVLDWAKDFSVKGIAQKAGAGAALTELYKLLGGKP